MIRKIIGYSIASSPLIMIFIRCAINEGLIYALSMVGGVFLLAGVIFFGIWLAEE